MDQSMAEATATSRDPWWELPREEKKRILQDMWAAALMDDLHLRDADDEDAEAEAATCTCGGVVVPASKKAIVELHVPTWDEACCRSSSSTTAAAQDHGAGGCAVCLEALQMGQELRMMPCTHTFHQRCIFKWLVVNRHCPVCHFALPSSEEDQDHQDMEEEDYAAAEKRYYTPKFISFIMDF